MIKQPKAGDSAWHACPKTNRIRRVTVDGLDYLPTVSVLAGTERFEVMRRNLFRSYRAAMVQTWVNCANGASAGV